MSEELNRFQRIKSLLQDTKLIDSHTISLVVAECDMALTQRPAAQAGEREAFEAWVTLNSIIKQYRIKAEDAHWLRASLPTQPAAQDEREADEVFLPRRLAATQKLTQLGYRYDSAHGKWLPAPQQATPEPVGEAVAWWYIEDGEEKFGHPNGYRPDDARPLVFGDTRPAPGVPDDATLEGIATAACKHIDDDWFSAATVCALNALHTLRDEIAAAQAKGADK